MPARLVALDGGPDILVDRPLVVGRDLFCEARLDSPGVSRRHCFLTEVDGVVWVRDLGSTNGIRINSRWVLLGWLRPGDVLSVACFRYRVESVRAEWTSRAEAPNRPEADCSALASSTATRLSDVS